MFGVLKLLFPLSGEERQGKIIEISIIAVLHLFRFLGVQHSTFFLFSLQYVNSSSWKHVISIFCAYRQSLLGD